jgi:TnpA family transposase
MARAVCFNRLGEIRDRSFENQRHRASGLNLIVAAITLWNTIYGIVKLRRSAQTGVYENQPAQLSRIPISA